MPAVAPQPFNLFILGSGNVATHLSQALNQAGHRILGVYSRQRQHAAALAASFDGAVATDSLDFTCCPAADLYLVCVTDAALAGLMTQARFPAGSIVAHTSGSLPLAVLANPVVKPAVFYPIQTFSKNQPVDLTTTPIAVEAADPETAARVTRLAATITNRVVALSSEDRKYLHLAAVFACNFTNHLLGIGQELMQQHQLDPALLHPLIQTTFHKALSLPPFQVQTGPAVRGDEIILARQQKLLEHQPRYREIYALLSESIRQKRGVPPQNEA
jgi:predicted short-subunit dehydrogenase-like oxidoreductase (DUF2520 family)